MQYEDFICRKDKREAKESETELENGMRVKQGEGLTDETEKLVNNGCANSAVLV